MTARMSTPSTPRPGPRSPFSLPELRNRISHFVALKDAVACARVSRAWAQDYLPIIWYSIDCNKFAYSNIGSGFDIVVGKYAHHIRVANNVTFMSQMAILTKGNVTQLRELSITMTTSTFHYATALDFVARNSASLERLKLKPVPTSARKYESPLYCVHASMLVHSGLTSKTASRLRDLDVSGLWLMREGLSTILQGCPNLSHLNLSGTDVIGRASFNFQHEGLSFLTCSIITALRPDPTDSQQQPSPGLLMHFPNLKTWSTSGSESELRFVLPSGLLKAEVKLHCPLLSDVRLRDSPESMWVTLFTDVFSNLKEISFDYKSMSDQVLTTILLHQDTVESIQANPGLNFDFERDVFPGPVTDHFQASGRQVQLLPRSCTRLTELNLYPHVMDIDIMESKEWNCKDLRTLRTRIKGLDTKERILRAIDLWRAGWRKRVLARRRQSNNWYPTGNDSNMDESNRLLAHMFASIKMGMVSPGGVVLLDNDYSIEARVARHLLQFERLENVWLGYKTWHPY
ncbi:hypothetical protein BG015_009670 [Linnemannia schmuckeri]|uniref:F-box domain-containing protein n=1 Tax=Linnemannia schmuckeri TaxID=64567 RepID=A0A9P5RX98_9FUNG|nr:hypothetical protein BG015_009670 [Linnemannia schmuckeri]